jgi:uncharacterized repeat protein (TIGR01451 family)
MKHILLSVFLLTHTFLNTSAQWVTIPDASLASQLQQLFPSCLNGNQMDTTCSQITNATSLNLNGAGISDLNGVQYFDSLQILSCTNNSIGNLNFLPQGLLELNCSNNTSLTITSLPIGLTKLMARNCNLTTLPSLPGLLIELDCAQNQLSSLPLLPSSLEIMLLQDNLLSSLPPLPPNLNKLYIDNNLFSVFPSLPASVKYFSCRENTISNVPFLPPTLVFFDCSENNLSSLPPFPPTLRHLSCFNNQITSLPALPNVLFILNCSNNLITAMPPLSDSLKFLYCSYNQLTSLPRVPFAMTHFYIDNNQIVCLENLPFVSSPMAPSIANNPLTCVPNQTNYSGQLPLCMGNDPINNPNNCSGVANITGTVFTDLNVNCSLDSTDLAINNLPVMLLDGLNNLVALSYTIDGIYSFAGIQPDTFQVFIDDALLPVSMACAQSNSLTVILDSISQTNNGLNFSVVCDSLADVSVRSLSTAGWVFPGQIHMLNSIIEFNDQWYNLNCNNLNHSGTVTFTVTGHVTYVSPAANAMVPAVTGNVFTYTISDFSALTPASFGLLFLTDTIAQANDQVCVHVVLSPDPIDGDTTNNVYDFCYEVINSYDPNMKEVYPLDVLPGYDDWFTYTIHFQNTGNAPAFNILLKDTLDANLDINTFEMMGYSHPAIVSLNGNVLNVRYNNIMLPDSTSDYEASMGFFQYRIKPLPNLPQGTQIENTAYIYFDYNAPIVTNTTENNFILPTAIQEASLGKKEYRLYPNPGQGLFTFKDASHISSVEVFNAYGQQVLVQGNQKVIDLTAQAKGLYFVRINNNEILKLVKE